MGAVIHLHTVSGRSYTFRAKKDVTQEEMIEAKKH